MSLRATIIIPTFDHGPLIEYALDSATKQTIQDIEIFVIGDGVPDVTKEIMAKWVAQDQRVRYFDYPKNARHGEIYRHEVITQHAQGNIICYLSDDDLWLPNHLEVMEQLLLSADFGHTLPVLIYPEGLYVLWTDVSSPYYRDYILHVANRVPLSNMGHTRKAYDRLPHGWRTTPKGTPTDHYMYRQILAESWSVAKSSMEPTVIHLPSSQRVGWSMAQRLEELSSYHARMNVAGGLAGWRNQQIEYCARQCITFEQALSSKEQALSLIEQALSSKEQALSLVEQSRWWRLRSKILVWIAMFPFVLKLLSLKALRDPVSK